MLNLINPRKWSTEIKEVVSLAIVRIPTNKIEQLDIKAILGGATGSEIKAMYKPSAFMNLALYDMATKTNIVKLIADNMESGYLFADEGIGITTDNKPIWCSLSDARTNENIRGYVSGAPVLVKAGKVSIDWGNKVSTQIQGKHIRTAVGFGDGDLVMYVSEDSITLETLADRMIDYGCEYAINCDGGGSSHLYSEGKTYKSSIRANPTWLLVYKKKEDNTVNKKFKVCLDAGHGGSDPGATSGKLYEKDINLKVVDIMKEFLETYDIEVVLTRDSDKTVSLEERVEIANDNKVDLYFSVHCNSATNTAAKGWEIFIVAKGGKAEKLANRVKDKVFEDATIKLKNRGIKTANFYVIRETDAPAVLVENAFISNSDDRVNILKSDLMLNYLASSYCTAILEMLGVSLDIKKPEVEPNTFEIALNILENKKVITSTEYWKNNASKLQYLEQLIINMAKYIEENG
jgi:N-acetylmuramoyl-L-alanine amidase